MVYDISQDLNESSPHYLHHSGSFEPLFLKLTLQDEFLLFTATLQPICQRLCTCSHMIKSYVLLQAKYSFCKEILFFIYLFIYPIFF